MANWTKKLDVLFSKIIRSVGQCHRCGTNRNLQCAHIISRSYKQIRWNRDNALCLCQGCHLYFTHHPLEWQDYVNQSVGAKKYSRLKTMAQEYGKKIDHEGIYNDLAKYQALLLERFLT